MGHQDSIKWWIIKNLTYKDELPQTQWTYRKGYQWCLATCSIRLRNHRATSMTPSLLSSTFSSKTVCFLSKPQWLSQNLLFIINLQFLAMEEPQMTLIYSRETRAIKSMIVSRQLETCLCKKRRLMPSGECLQIVSKSWMATERTKC